MKHTAIAIATIFVLVTLTIPVLKATGDGPITRFPTRIGDLTMDMNISEKAEGSFQGEHSMPVFYELSLSGSGDVNGDGIDDLLIGSWGNNEGGDLAGQTYLIFGKAGGWYNDVNLTSSDASFIGEEDGNRSGKSVAIAGDVNGDGFDDILIGAYGGTSWTYLIFGKSSGWSMDTELTDSDASFGGESDYAGMSVSGAGDVNDDGYDDFLIGAMAGGVGLQGEAYLFLGKSSGWAMNTPISTGASASYLGEAADDNAGISVSEAGDVNGDDFDDFLIGASANDEGGDHAGQSYLVLGKGSGWTMDTNLSTSDASFIGENADDQSGYTTTGAGDVNGDGYDDILISAEGNDEGGSDAGQTYLVLGKATGWAMDTDLSTVDASFIGENADDYASFSISGAGDVDGDGLDDILIGAVGNDEGGSTSGQTYLILGGSLSMDTDLSMADASFIGEHPEDRCGNSVTGGFDINGDGSDDIVIASPTNDENGDSTGETYVITGFGNCEPLEVYSLKATDGVGNVIDKADIGDTINLELQGLDGNTTHQDSALVNITFGKSFPGTFHIPLRETGLNTGIYRGKYLIPLKTIYFDSVQIYSRKDPTKQVDLVVDYPFRPYSTSSIKLFKESSFSEPCDKADFLDRVFIEAKGLDANNIKMDKAFVNISSDKNSSLVQMLILRETGVATGTYRGSIDIPSTMEYFENITITSVETVTVKAKFMVHTPVQIRAKSQYQTTVEDEEYRIGFYNFGYNTATWTMTTGAAWLTWDNTNKEIYGTPRNNHVGKDLWNVLLLLEDSYGHSHNIDYNLTVINTLPKMTTEPITECFEKDMYTLDVNCDDDDQGDVNYYLNTNSPFLAIDKKTGLLEGTPIEGDEGIYKVNVQVQDGNGGSANLIFNLTVLGRNDRPRITNDDIKQIEQDTPFRRDYEVFDPDEGDTHTWTLRTDADWLSIENGTGVLFGTPDGFDLGDWLVNITVTDSGGLNDSREFTLKVLDKKDKPIWIDVPTDVVLVHGTKYYFDANATDADVGSVLVYSIETETECDMRINSKTGEIGLTANYRCMPKIGGILVTLKVSDGDLFSIHEFMIRVTPTGSPTVIINSPQKGARTPSTETKLEWEGTDPENEPLSYTLYLADSESYVMAKRENDIREKNITGNNYTITGLTQGKTYYWTVIPDDGCTNGRCTNGIFSFRVNSRPVLKEITGQSAETGKEFNYKLEGSDGDQDDKLTYTVLSGPEGLTVRSGSGMLVWTPKDSQTGVHKVRVKVTDGYESVERSFDVEVSEGSALDMGLMIGIGIGVLILIIAILLIYILVIKGKGEDKKEEEDEETRKMREDMEQKQKERDWEEAHTRDSDHTPVSDVPISAIDAHAHDHDSKPKSADELYGTKIPEEEDKDILEDMISIAPKKTSDIESHGLPLEPEDMELKSVDDPYDHFGETEDEIKK